MCCLQKTHIKYKFAEKLKEKECKKIYCVNTNQKKAGKSILISDKVDLKQGIFLGIKTNIT